MDIYSFKKFVPRSIKELFKRSMIFNRVAAKKLASTSKKLDLCSAQMAHLLHLSGLAGMKPVKNKICIEIGSGWVLSHALVLHILGAKSVIATDIESVAFPSTLYSAIHKSTISIIRDVLSPFEDHAEIRQRLNNLVQIRKFDFNSLKDMGITYVAPIDLSKNTLDMTYDMCFSNSVLEHVPKSDVVPLLQNLDSNLSLYGKMFHSVHLEDHNSIQNNPFEFLSETSKTFTNSVQSARGNRIRYSEWCEILSSINCLDLRIIYEWSRNDKCLPARIDNSIKHTGQKDLMCTHLGIYAEKIK